MGKEILYFIPFPYLRAMQGARHHFLTQYRLHLFCIFMLTWIYTDQGLRHSLKTSSLCISTQNKSWIGIDTINIPKCLVFAREVNQKNLHLNYCYYLLWLKTEPKGEFSKLCESMWWCLHRLRLENRQMVKHVDAGY